MNARGRASRGAVLLEVLIALAILGTAGVELAVVTREALGAVERAQAAEADINEASALMAVVSLWSRADLDRHLGVRPEGRWRLILDRSQPTLYGVALADSASGRVVLQTTLYRPPVMDSVP